MSPFSSSIRHGFHRLALYPLISSFLLTHTLAMQIHLTWPIQTDCDQVIDPKWPFAYSKYHGQEEELKGRVSSNRQDVRHVCQTRGVRSKCHICEDFSCGESNNHSLLANSTLDRNVHDENGQGSNTTWLHQCHFQLQGVLWTRLAKNIPTVSDVPWAVGGNYRYDFGGENTTHICMYLSGTFPCQSNWGYDYSSCRTRCWGYKTGWSGLKNNIVSSSNKGWNLLFNATPWMTPEPSVTWSYPKEEGNVGDVDANHHPTFLPQGYTFTLAGSVRGEYGFKDGTGHEARFFHPEGVAVDHNGYVYVADTGNHAIRMISPTGKVTTLAGTGKAGSKDGPGMFVAEFSSPSDVAVWRDWQFWPYPDKHDPDTLLCRNGNGTLVLFVADTGNHRIRKITGDIVASQDGELEWNNVLVSCHSGLCMDDDGIIKGRPKPGFSDGSKHVARFDSPRGLTMSHDGTVFVADSNNHLVRMVDRNGFTRTVAGQVPASSQIDSANRLLRVQTDSCPSNDRIQVPDYIIDGTFSFPSDIALGHNQTYLLVTDQHSLQLIDLVQSTVVTIAGDMMEGTKDGFGIEASFSQPESVIVTADDRIYSSDSSSCRIRRISRASDIAQNLSCEDTLELIFRPQGCTSYHPAVDTNKLLISPISGSIFYNYAYRNNTNETFGSQYIGKTIKNCIGSPPSERKTWVQRDGLVIDDGNTMGREDPNEGSLIKVYCPSDCDSSGNYSMVEGFLGLGVTLFYESSPICAAAMYLNIIDRKGGLVDVNITRLDPMMNGTAFSYSLSTKQYLGETFDKDRGRYYSVTRGSTEWLVETISGGSDPTAKPLRRPSGCGYLDTFPPQDALFDSPKGLGAFVNSSIDDNMHHLIVADRNNHALRSMSSVCSFICENDGRCIGPNKCQCTRGWSGDDCSVPICSVKCPSRHICVAPDTCSCIPGYEGKFCDRALCEQNCRHGTCVAPDTCSCISGWFDFQCGSPVCEQTCGNHGICIAPNKCRCRNGWGGNDCRTPICIQECRNGGFCVAPNTCQCSPDWTGHACKFPVCRQGDFIPFQAQSHQLLNWNQFTPCNYQMWCEATQSFDCLQKSKTTQLVDPKVEVPESIIRDREDKLFHCILLEVRPDALSMFSPISSTDEATSPPRRYSSPLPFGPLSEDHQDWNEVEESSSRFDTQSWSSSLDRQVIVVEYRNIVQGAYACANGGKCVAPDVCSCAHGFIGFDCRTPVCEQGFYEPQQPKMTKTLDDDGALAIFNDFLSKNLSYHDEPKSDRSSNPKVIRVVESFVNYTAVERITIEVGNVPYLALDGLQGGYSCSIRSVSQWENASFVFEHPNYYSRYMDTKVEDDNRRYTFWENMGWSPTHKKSRPLEIPLSNLEPKFNNTSRRFVYTDEGYRRDGTWSRTGQHWEKGLCMVEFHRMNSGSDDPSLIIVQDTDISFRPRCYYDDEREYCSSLWDSGTGGERIDHVKRGCFNNGTCVGPNKCACSEGFMGDDCSIPICTQKCVHGNCTLPNQCTCEKGWRGNECSFPICAQDCNNFGFCSAPDTCTCVKWESQWRDGRDAPLFQTPDGRPQLTGWTGYDCSTPICVQAEKFVLNVNLKSYSLEDLVLLGGHGRDGTLMCSNVSCPIYDEMVTMNDGRSFQTGCGFDPLFTGCCTIDTSHDGRGILYSCYKCAIPSIGAANHSLCLSGDMQAGTYTNIDHIPAQFKFKSGRSQSLKLCGPQHNPGYYASTDPFALPVYSNRNFLSNSTSDYYLCKRFQWEEGDYTYGRYTRINYENFIRNDSNPEIWSQGITIPGEGIFECYNRGSCIGPDVCSCRDGYSGFDCKTALCRHKQRNGNIVGCLNHGTCVARDTCLCPQVPSVLWTEHPLAVGGLTGYTGSDCSIPICVQGFYDPTCEGDLAIGGEGCYRCPNGGYCTGPDECTCAQGWTGFSCEVPVCETVVTPELRLQLMTEDDAKVVIFEKDPCGMRGFYDPETINGIEYYRGNCTRPNQCTCLCKARYDSKLCRAVGGIFCRAPFQDPFYKYRNVLAPNELFGTRSCSSGYEGLVDENDKFMSCHMTIYEPTVFVRHSALIVIFSLLVFILCSCAFFCTRTIVRIRGKQTKVKHERGVRTPTKSVKVKRI